MACGWGAWRPQHGSLVPAREQAWAADFPESSNKIRKAARRDRLSWLDAAGKPALTMLSQEEAAGRPEAVADQDLETTYCDRQDQPDLTLDLDQDFLEGHEASLTRAAHVHPKDRSLMQQYEAELLLMTSQAPPTKPPKNPERSGKTPRPQLAAQWREGLGKKDVTARLNSVVPLAKKCKKTGKPARLPRFTKHSLLTTVQRFEKNRKNKKRQAAKKKQADAAAASGPLVTKRFRVISQTQSRLHLNLEGVCTLHFEQTAEVQLRLATENGKGLELKLPVSHAWQLTGKETLPMGEAICPDLRTVKDCTKQRALAACGNEVQLLLPDQFMQGPEMAAIWQLVLLSGYRAGCSPEAASPQPGGKAGCHFLNPEASRTRAAPHRSSRALAAQEQQPN